MAITPAELPKPIDRSWQQIATELIHESDLDKVLILSEELCRALDKGNARHYCSAA